MFDLLHRVSDVLGSVDHALIGAGAMSVAGYTRATQDLDLLVLDEKVFDSGFWAELRASGIKVEIRDGRSDPEDPLKGVVQIVDPNDEIGAIDVVVGRKPRWQKPILARARRVPLGGREVAVATAADLVLLKLDAGGYGDQSDIRELLATDPAIVGLVDERVKAMSRDCRILWTQLRPK